MSRPARLLKPLVAVFGLVGTIASIWWFALKPRHKGSPASPPDSTAGRDD